MSEETGPSLGTRGVLSLTPGWWFVSDPSRRGEGTRRDPHTPVESLGRVIWTSVGPRKVRPRDPRREGKVVADTGRVEGT